jgi:hypothetical protein
MVNYFSSLNGVRSGTKLVSNRISSLYIHLTSCIQNTNESFYFVLLISQANNQCTMLTRMVVKFPVLDSDSELAACCLYREDDRRNPISSNNKAPYLIFSVCNANSVIAHRSLNCGSFYKSMADSLDPPPPPATGDPRNQFLCLTICGYRRPGMSESDYRDHMMNVSAPMTKDLMVKYGVKRWTVVCTH